MSSNVICEISDWFYGNNQEFGAKQTIKESGLVVCDEDSSQPKCIH